MAEKQDRKNRSTEGGASFTLRDLLTVVFRHKHLVVVTFVVILLATAIAAWLEPESFQAEMKFMVKKDRVDPIVSERTDVGIRTVSQVTEQELQSEVELLKSWDLLEKVAEAAGVRPPKPSSSWASRLFPGAEAASTTTPATVQTSALYGSPALAAAVGIVEQRLKVNTIPNTNLIAARYESTDPKEAVRVLEQLAELFLQKHLAVHRAPGTFTFFQRESERSQAELDQAQEGLIAFRNLRGLVAPVTEKEITLQRLGEFEARLRETQADITETQQRISALEKQLEEATDRQVTSVQTSQNPQVARLKGELSDLEIKRLDLAGKFTPTYRLVQQLDLQIEQTKAELAREEAKPAVVQTTDRDPNYEWLRSELTKAKTELAGLVAREQQTAQTVDTYRGRARTISELEIREQDLLRASKVAEENYMLYRQRQEEARISDLLDTQRIVNVAVAQSATVPVTPSNPSRSMVLLLGFLIASFVSVGMAFVWDRFDPTFRAPDEVERELGLPVLASISKSK